MRVMSIEDKCETRALGSIFWQATLFGMVVFLRRQDAKALE